MERDLPLLWFIRWPSLTVRAAFLFATALATGGAVEAGASPAWLAYAAFLSLVTFCWVALGENEA